VHTCYRIRKARQIKDSFLSCDIEQVPHLLILNRIIISWSAYFTYIVFYVLHLATLQVGKEGPLGGDPHGGALRGYVRERERGRGDATRRRGCYLVREWLNREA
jgi:hypothetical protein